MSETFQTDNESIHQELEPKGDVDESGQLALGLFIGVIILLLVAIYAFAMAA